jgi:TolB protein
MNRLIAAVFLVLAQASAWAQFRIEVTGVGLTQVPLAVVAFKGEDRVTQKVSAIVLADLERSGQFRGIETAGFLMDEITRPDFSVWRQKNSDALVAGSVTRLADGKYDVRVHLWDVVRGQDQGAWSNAVVAADLRLAAHRIADFVYEKLTGDKGIFSTRIAYVTKRGQNFNLWVADADGESAQSALNSAEPIISPAWSPTGNHLAYVSFEARKPTIYVHEVSTGKRRLVANFKGSNSAPAWSPDGRYLAVTLSRDGGSQLFLLDLTAPGAEPRRLIQSGSIDTEPIFTADGQSILFVSDRGGAPQIYRVPVSGGNPERVTFTGSYNISPALSPDGRWLAFISRINGAFKLQVMEMATGNVAAITDTGADEKPSFSPNGKMLIYATQQDGKEALMTTTLDGKIKARLAGQTGDIREPNWGPFQK